MPVPKETKIRREFLYNRARRMCLLNNRMEFIKLMPMLLQEANLPVPTSNKTFYNDWDWICKQELDISQRRDEASRLITMAEDMALNNEDPATVLRAAELILKHSNPFVQPDSRLREGLNLTADLANSFGTDPPPPPEPPEEVQDWMDDVRQRGGES